MTKAIITDALNLIFEGITRLKDVFPGKEFTIDGRLVGDIGEVIAALDYDIQLYNVLQAGHDGQTSDGRRVQVKATFKDSLTLSSIPDYYLGFKLHKDGRYEEVYNGPGSAICERYSHRKGIGRTLLSFPINELHKLSSGVKQEDRIPKRGASTSHHNGRLIAAARRNRGQPLTFDMVSWIFEISFSSSLFLTARRDNLSYTLLTAE
jgi:hypothetical protein